VQLRDAAVRLAAHLASRRRVHGVSVTFEDTRRSLREPYGGVVLDEADRRLLADPGAGVYVDCLHFDPPFFAHLARLTGDGSWAARAVEEALGYRDLLRDHASGLYHHFWLERTGRAYARGWGRGQGWALLGLLDLAVLLPEGHHRHDIMDAAVALAAAMRERQRPNGHWWAMVDEPASGDEASTAAFMAAAFYRGVAMGLLPADPYLGAAERAWRATWSALDAQGLLTGVSAAVYSSTDPRHYHHVPRGLDVPWGQGPVLVAALARSRAGA
jgi:unsaturated rhamnogalacturonyl hydrolase